MLCVRCARAVPALSPCCAKPPPWKVSRAHGDNACPQRGAGANQPKGLGGMGSTLRTTLSAFGLVVCRCAGAPDSMTSPMPWSPAPGDACTNNWNSTPRPGGFGIADDQTFYTAYSTGRTYDAKGPPPYLFIRCNEMHLSWTLCPTFGQLNPPSAWVPLAAHPVASPSPSPPHPAALAPSTLPSH